MGTVNYKNPGQSFFTRDFLCHPQYSSRTIDYDYAIITIPAATVNSAVSRKTNMVALGLGTHLFVKLPRPGNSEVNFSVFESSCHLLTSV